MEIMEVLERKAQNAFLNRLGLTEADVRETFSRPGFSIKQLRENMLEDQINGNLREGTAETSFGQLLRVGVQALASDYFAWAGTETIFQDIVMEMPSNKAMEFYAPMYGGQLPKPVERSGRYASSYFKGTDSMLVNEKFGRLYEFEKELWEDDKTGQIKQKAADIGQGMRIVQEMWFNARLTGTAQSFAEDIFVPAPAVVTTPYSAAIGNQDAGVNTRLSQAALEAASVAMLKIRDPLNNLLLTKMDTLIVGVDDMFNAAKLINSTLQPSVPGTSLQVMGGNTVSGTPTTQGVLGGQIGWTNTINPLYGLYKLKVSRYLPSYNWFLLQAKKGLLYQNRSPLEIVQENPTAGDSFNRDVLIFKSSARWQIDFINGSNLFIYRGFHS
jgi:hypothetical protein